MDSISLCCSETTPSELKTTARWMSPWLGVWYHFHIAAQQAAEAAAKAAAEAHRQWLAANNGS